jgi:hypothetical protein
VNVTGFRLDRVDDQGLTVSRFDVNSDQLAAECERSWLLALSVPHEGKPPDAFRYPTARIEPVEMSYKRYADADVEDVDAAVAVAGLPLRERAVWPWVLAGIAPVIVLGFAANRVLRRRKPVDRPVVAYQVPATLTPFTLVQLLRRIGGDARTALTDGRRRELTDLISTLEAEYFRPAAEGSNSQRPLRDLAEEWVSQANGR